MGSKQLFTRQRLYLTVFRWILRAVDYNLASLLCMHSLCVNCIRHVQPVAAEKWSELKLMCATGVVTGAVPTKWREFGSNYFRVLRVMIARRGRNCWVWNCLHRFIHFPRSPCTRQLTSHLLASPFSSLLSSRGDHVCSRQDVKIQLRTNQFPLPSHKRCYQRAWFGSFCLIHWEQSMS